MRITAIARAIEAAAREILGNLPDAEAAELPAGGEPAKPKISVDDQLLNALGADSDLWKDIWDEHRKKGLDDAELKKVIGDKFGIYAGYSGGGYHYSVRGLSKPRFFLGTDTTLPTLSGAKLIDRARILLQIPRPVPPPPADPQTDDLLDLRDDEQPAANPALTRLSGMLDSQDPSRNLNGQQTDGLPPWTSEDLERELLHALGDGPRPEIRPCWKRLISDGATIEEIGAALHLIWPSQRITVTAKESGGKLGYSIQCARIPGSYYFWLGGFRGVGHKATLSGLDLIDRIRTVLEIPTPTQAQKAAQASFREACINQGIPMNPASVQQKKAGGPRFVMPELPADGWDEAELANAAEDLGLTVAALAVCEKCQAVRDHVVHPCPNCRSPNYKRTDSPAVWGAPPAEPVKRGRGRPPGAKTRNRKAAVDG